MAFYVSYVTLLSLTHTNHFRALSIHAPLLLVATLATCPSTYSRLLPLPLHSKLFIGGLNWDTTDGIIIISCNLYITDFVMFICSEGLRDYFSQFGKVS